MPLLLNQLTLKIQSPIPTKALIKKKDKKFSLIVYYNILYLTVANLRPVYTIRPMSKADKFLLP